MLVNNRTALLIRCSVYAAEQIRRRAASERRTISGYVLNILGRQMRIDEKLINEIMPGRNLARPNSEVLPRGVESRTAVLLRCSVEEASRIRAAAKRRETTIAGYVLHALNVTWKVVPERMG